eukprot:CAMPEP_0182443080 /NCGR_PEP_ID=MMETSP1172-20130603/1915_1 /TAXON_ID=708627 /ORGANISM="Timspurckia oligopyrenoides, Strain CCMP3278" /LENGTH=332 /DNA_ID=CAMNT_0024638247 /DNA_START=78 /DNA_END=1073 /DNA_ORIENTATION=+
MDLNESSSGSRTPRSPRTWIQVTTRNASAAMLGAFSTALVVTPLDVVKVQMQSHQCHSSSSSSSLTSLTCTNPHSHFRNTFDALVRIPQQHGLKALYRGLSTSLFLAIPTSGLYFTLYESLMHSIPKKNENASPQLALFCGASARIITAIVASPLELARTRAQASHTKYHLISDLKSVMNQNSGLKSLFRGLAPTLLRDAPFSAVYWSCYEYLKSSHSVLNTVYRRLKEYWKKNNDSTLSERIVLERSSGVGLYIVAGSISGMVAAAVTTPADVVKTRMQTELKESVSVVAVNILKNEGWRGFCKGIGARVGKVTPACAIMMGTYEMVKSVW